MNYHFKLIPSFHLQCRFTYRYAFSVATLFRSLRLNLRFTYNVVSLIATLKPSFHLSLRLSNRQEINPVYHDLFSAQTIYPDNKPFYPNSD